MQMNTRIKPRAVTTILCVLALAIVALPTSAEADTITIKRDSYGCGRDMEVWGAGEHFTTHAGVRVLKKNGGTGEGQLWADGLIPSFCIELDENTSTSYRIYNVDAVRDAHDPTFDGTKLGAAKEDYLGVLISMFWDEGWETSSPWTSSQKTGAAAFQLCVWEIVYEHEFLSGTPSFNVKSSNWDGDNDWYFAADGNNTVENLANSWLSQLDPTLDKPGNLRAFTRVGYQDFLVPEPATMGLLAVGGIAVLRRRRTRTNS